MHTHDLFPYLRRVHFTMSFISNVDLNQYMYRSVLGFPGIPVVQYVYLLHIADMQRSGALYTRDVTYF